MKLLIIGGTQFVGRHLMEAALARGDQVTLFNRGQTVIELPAGVELRRGDRRQDLSALAEGTWDTVVDACGYLPGEVSRMAELLAARIGCYAFISSVSAYADARQPNDEGSALGRMDDPETEVVDGRTYGPLKALCEQAVLQHVGVQHSLLIRPGLVVGPYDPTQRFTWWPARMARVAHDGAPVLAPGIPDRPLQFVDARDLAAFVLHALDTGRRGVFNAVAPPGFTTMAALLAHCAEAAGVAADLQWVSELQLLQQGVKPWVDLPLWLPSDGEYASFMAVNSDKAQAAGMHNRPLTQTIADTLAWWRSLPPDQQAFTKAGLAPEREAELISAARQAV